MEDLCLVVSSFQHKFSIFYNNILFGSAVQSCSTAAANSSQESMQTKIVLFLVWKIKFHVQTTTKNFISAFLASLLLWFMDGRSTTELQSRTSTFCSKGN